MNGRADQFSNLRGTGILPVAEKHGQDARATPNGVTQLEQLIGPAVNGCVLDSEPLPVYTCRCLAGFGSRAANKFAG